MNEHVMAKLHYYDIRSTQNVLLIPVSVFLAWGAGGYMAREAPLKMVLAEC